MQRKAIVVGNWKMYKTREETYEFFSVFLPAIKKASCRILIAPSFTLLGFAKEATQDTLIEIGAQNMSDAEEGPFTGEVSFLMLKDVGASFVILGHSERRAHFHETNKRIHYKLKRAMQAEFTSILCVGETEKQREEGVSEEVIQEQLAGCLGGFTSEELSSLMIAYEPVWAIGTGKSATAEIAAKAHRWIRTYLEQTWGKEVAKRTPILYGGSVSPRNIASLLEKKEIDGVLVGGASLEPLAFAEIVMEGSKR